MDLQPPVQSNRRLPPEVAHKIRTSPPLVMNLKEAAAYLCCSERKLRYLVVDRRIRSSRVGAKIIIRLQWLDEFIGK